MLTQNPAASVGLYVDCGSIYETPYSRGATHLLERMAFKSTLNRSHLRLVREIESMGASTSASASREQMGYTIDALKTYVPHMVEVLVDSVRNPAFLDWEVNEEVIIIMSCFAIYLFLTLCFLHLTARESESGDRRACKEPYGLSPRGGSFCCLLWRYG